MIWLTESYIEQYLEVVNAVGASERRSTSHQSLLRRFTRRSGATYVAASPAIRAGRLAPRIWRAMTRPSEAAPQGKRIVR